MKYSIVVPVHNEGETLERFVAEFICEMPRCVSTVLLEIVLVENGSTDRTSQVCKQLQQAFPTIVRPLSVDRPSYGEAIKRGVLESRGTHVSILECDLLDLHFVERSIALFSDDKAKFIIASKRHPLSIDQRPLKRRFLTWGFNWILNNLVGYPGTDTHGLKSIEAELAKQLCHLALTTDEVFQTEMVLIAWRLGHRIEELPVRIQEMRPAPVSIKRRVPKVIRMVTELRRSIERFPVVGRIELAERIGATPR